MPTRIIVIDGPLVIGGIQLVDVVKGKLEVQCRRSGCVLVVHENVEKSKSISDRLTISNFIEKKTEDLLEPDQNGVIDLGIKSDKIFEIIGLYDNVVVLLCGRYCLNYKSYESFLAKAREDMRQQNSKIELCRLVVHTNPSFVEAFEHINALRYEDAVLARFRGTLRKLCFDWSYYHICASKLFVALGLKLEQQQGHFQEFVSDKILDGHGIDYLEVSETIDSSSPISENENYTVNGLPPGQNPWRWVVQFEAAPVKRERR